MSQADTPLSPPVTANNINQSCLYKPVESPLASEQPKSEEQPAASLNNLANSLLSSDEMTEKIKQILCQINMTKPLEDVKEPEPVDKLTTSVIDVDFNPKPQQTNYNNYNNNGNNEYKKNSKWGSNYQGNNNNKFQNNYKNNDSRGHHNNNNNRNTFQNNFRRGIGNRGGAEGSNHGNFNNRNFNNDGFGSKFNNNRGGGSHRNFNNGHRNNSRFDHNKRESRFDSGADNGANRKSVYENDKPKETAAPAASNVGRWI